MKKISKIRSGGQTGVDRAALDIAKQYSIDICGWCPKGGRAEDYPPSLLLKYPELTETPFEKEEQRTVWNVRDSDATLILPRGGNSKGTVLTQKAAETLKKPFLVSTGESKEIIEWLNTLPQRLDLNIAGPRESECPGVYKSTVSLLNEVLSDMWRE